LGPSEERAHHEAGQVVAVLAFDVLLDDRESRLQARAINL
jgi:hypothetical protein